MHLALSRLTTSFIANPTFLRTSLHVRRRAFICMAAKPPNGIVAFVGAGNMGRAMIEGLVSQGMDPNLIRASARTERTLSLLPLPDTSKYTDNSKAVKEARVIMLCVKPYLVRDVIREISASMPLNAMLVSIAAGRSITNIEQWLKEARPKSSAVIVRAMPNLAATIGCSATGVCYHELPERRPSPDQKEQIRAIFEAVGDVHEINENLIDAVTAVSAGGVAYGLVMAEALADAAVKHGIPREMARAIAARAVEGAGSLARNNSHKHTATLRNEIESPGGTTIAAYAALERRGFRAALIDAVDAAMQRVNGMNQERK